MSSQPQTFARVLHKNHEDPKALVVNMRVDSVDLLKDVRIQYNPFGEFGLWPIFERNVSTMRKGIFLPWGLEQQAAIVDGLLNRIYVNPSDTYKCIDTVHGYILHCLLKGTDEFGPLVVTPGHGPYPDPELARPITAPERKKSPRSRGRRPLAGKPQERRTYSREVADCIQAFFMGEAQPHRLGAGEFVLLSRAAQEVDIIDLEGEYIYDQEMDPVVDPETGEPTFTEGTIVFGNWRLPIGTIVKGVPRNVYGGEPVEEQ